MSCKYYLVDSQKLALKKEVLSILDSVKQEGDRLFALGTSPESPYPAILANQNASILEAVQSELARAISNVQYAVDWDEDSGIGTMTSNGFRWDDFYGFRCLDDLKRHMREHPEAVLQDEYGEVFTLEQFLEIIKG